MPIDEALTRLCGGTDGGEVPRVLVVAAHPDDETIGAGARIARLAPGCTVVHVTDGAPSDRRFFPGGVQGLSRPAYARRRREEALQALGCAGVDGSRVLCLGVRDQEAAFDMAGLAEQLHSIVSEMLPDVLLTHPYEGGHPDHDTTAFAVRAAATRMAASGISPPPIVEMTSYHDEGGATVRGEFIGPRGAREVTTELTDEDRKCKRAMLAAYSTQRDILSPFRVETERFRMAPRYAFGAPPHKGRLHYERFGFGISGAMWRALARAAMKKLGLREGSS